MWTVDSVYDAIYAGGFEGSDHGFREAALEAAGLRGNPKAYEAWNLAYEHAHADGRGDTFALLLDLADLLGVS